MLSIDIDFIPSSHGLFSRALKVMCEYQEDRPGLESRVGDQSERLSVRLEWKF